MCNQIITASTADAPLRALAAGAAVGRLSAGDQEAYLCSVKKCSKQQATFVCTCTFMSHATTRRISAPSGGQLRQGRTFWNTGDLCCAQEQNADKFGGDTPLYRNGRGQYQVAKIQGTLQAMCARFQSRSTRTSSMGPAHHRCRRSCAQWPRLRQDSIAIADDMSAVRTLLGQIASEIGIS